MSKTYRFETQYQENATFDKSYCRGFPWTIWIHMAYLITDSTMNVDRLGVPTTYEDAFNSDVPPRGRKAMNEEFLPLKQLETCSLVPLPKNRKCVKTK